MSNQAGRKDERKTARKAPDKSLSVTDSHSSLITHHSSLPLVIVNPTSAGGATGRMWPRLASDLRTHFGAFNCYFTQGTGDGRAIAEREAKAGRTLLIACGGDGTISEVANGILASGADAELGILPSGTGGDFRRTLKIPNRGADAAAALRSSRSVKIDVGRMEFHTFDRSRATRYCLNVASCGMGGEVIRRLRDSSSTRPAYLSRLFGGRAAYALASLETAVSYTKSMLRLKLDDHPETRLITANLCVANARYFGGGMKIAPEAKVDDGLLDVVAIGDLDALQITSNVHRLYFGTHLGMQQIHHARARRIEVSAARIDEQVAIEIDGELAGILPATFEILPRALRLRVPA